MARMARVVVTFYPHHVTQRGIGILSRNVVCPRNVGEPVACVTIAIPP